MAKESREQRTTPPRLEVVPLQPSGTEPGGGVRTAPAPLERAFDAEHAVVLARGDVHVALCLVSGKVLRLVARGRDWLVSPLASEDARLVAGEVARDEIFDIRHAWGADECLPTVGAFPGVRDHGSVWGRPCLVTVHASTRHECRWVIEGQRVTRRIELEEVGTEGVRILVELEFPTLWETDVESSRTGVTLALETLYAFHALFLAEEGSCLTLKESGHDAFRGAFPSPSHPAARKFFARADEGRLSHPDGTRVIVRLLEGLGWFGVWWCNDAWGDGRVHRTVGLEPTTHPSDGPIFRSAVEGAAGTAEGLIAGKGDPSRKRVAFSLEFPA